MRRPKILVIGRGPAGLVAASLLAPQAEITVVADAAGSLGLFSATLDFWGRDVSGAPVDDPFEVPKYTVTGPAARLDRSRWQGVWQWFARLLREAGVPYPTALPKHNTWVVSASGVPRRTFLVPSWLLTMDGPAPVAFIGLPGLLDTPPAWLARRYGKATGQETVSYTLDGLTRPWDVMRWAGYLDRADGEEQLVRALLTLKGPSRDLPWVMPGILGIRNTERIQSRLRDEGIRLAEMAAVPPAVAGVRLDERWRAHLRGAGVMWRSGRVVHLGERSARLADGAEIPFDDAVRATGGILGGGIRVHSDFTAIDTLTGREIGKVPRGAAASFGLSDEILETAQVAAAGQDVGGTDSAREENGIGTVLATAYLAAEKVRRRLGLDPLGPDEEMQTHGT